MSSLPAELKYTADHEWVRVEGDTVVVGITAYAADALGDVVYLELPSVGDQITAAGVCGEIESTKSVSDFLAPVDGEVLEVNNVAVEDPGVVNSDPYGAGWLVKIKVEGSPELLAADQYATLISGNDS